MCMCEIWMWEWRRERLNVITAFIIRVVPSLLVSLLHENGQRAQRKSADRWRQKDVVANRGIKISAFTSASVTAFISISYDNMLLAQMCNARQRDDNTATGQMIQHVTHKPTVHSDRLNHFIVLNVHITIISQNLLHSLLQISLTVWIWTAKTYKIKPRF